jgi:hypothetical protein
VLMRGGGMKRCRAEGTEHFALFVGAAVLANDLMIIGELLTNRSRPRRKTGTPSRCRVGDIKAGRYAAGAVRRGPEVMRNDRAIPAPQRAAWEAHQARADERATKACPHCERATGDRHNEPQWHC